MDDAAQTFKGGKAFRGGREGKKPLSGKRKEAVSSNFLEGKDIIRSRKRGTAHNPLQKKFVGERKGRPSQTRKKREKKVSSLLTSVGRALIERRRVERRLFLHRGEGKGS